MPAFDAFKEKAGGIFAGVGNYEKFRLQQGPQQGGYDAMEGGDEYKDGGESPCSFEEIERPPLRQVDKYLPAKCPCIKTVRYTVAIMTCLGFIISFGMKCNIGMAKLKLMGKESNTSKTHSFHIHWSVGQESAVDSSFFWGYLLTQIPGGFLASMFPASRIFGTAIATSAFLNLLLPGAIMLHPMAVVILRVFQGLVEGVIYPACHGIWRFWAPPLERSRLATMAFSGTYAGIVLGMPLSGILSDIGYGASFFFYGVMGIIWYLCWLWLVFEKPNKHPAITVKELKYIEKSLGESVQLAMPTIATTPFREIFHSMPVYAIIVANFCRSWNFYMLVIYQSAYLKHRFNFMIEEAGIVGALPHIIMTIIVPLGGLLADHLRKNGILSTTMVRKIFNCGGFGLEGLFFLVVAQAKTSGGAVTALTLGVAFSGFAISGYNVNHLDIAPRYASILMGMSNGIGTMAGIICPIVIDHLTEDKDDPTCWAAMFRIGALVHLMGCTFYAIFASGELQSWAEPTEEQQANWPGAVPPPRPPAPPMMQETNLDDNQYTQINSQPTVNYGATEHVTGNPFLYPSLTAEEPVQPYATDNYMHGSAEDRTY